MPDESWKEFPDKSAIPPETDWKRLHEVLAKITQNGVNYCIGIFSYEYFRKYCYLPGAGFYFNTDYLCYDTGIPIPIDKVLSEESFFQQSTINDYYDLTFDEIVLLRKIYEFMIGDFP